MKNKLTKNEKISFAMKGRSLSKEHKKKLSLVKKGTIRTDLTKAKIKQTMLGDEFKFFKKDHPTVPQVE
ncbi:hypothetical protein [Sporosarcina sp. G11-34]|uniref:hypothetical protein n=1 Tax=Sporosarcina sp. G11-34 TaxID=2849605 RepID=UPI0022A9DBC2|nr:hypothetical protein [Sporosarcina sp. G11-34]